MFKQMYKEKFMRFPQGKTKALTFSYDDGVAADKHLIEIFNRYGLKATFNLNNPLYGAGKHKTMDADAAYKTYSNCGHEIALHGDKHVFLNRVSLPEAALEITENRKYLEQTYNTIVRGMAYAYSAYTDEVVELLKALGVTYSRTTEPSHSFALPADWLRLKPTCHYADEKLFELLGEFLKVAPDKEFKKRGCLLFYVWGHSYEFDDNNNWHIIEEFCKKVAGNKDIWYATNGEIREYVRAYENLVFSIDGERVYNPSHISVWIDIRGKVYEVKGGQTLAF